MIIIDEIDARRIAELHNIKKVGFLGILIKAKQQQLLENVKDVLDLAISKGFWINKALYNTIILQLGERWYVPLREDNSRILYVDREQVLSGGYDDEIETDNFQPEGLVRSRGK